MRFISTKFFRLRKCVLSFGSGLIESCLLLELKDSVCLVTDKLCMGWIRRVNAEIKCPFILFD